MSDFQFKNVTFDVSGDPLRAQFRWWGDLDDAVPTRLSIWIKSHPNVHQNALLSVYVGPGSARPRAPFRFDFVTKEEVEGGSITEFSPGRLVVEFPRRLLRGYGPRVQWWADASLTLTDGPVGETGDGLDGYVDPDAGDFEVSAWFD